MYMVKESTFALLILLAVVFSSASSVFSAKDTPQFLPKIQAESTQFKEIYKPAQIYVEINSMSGDMDDLLEDLEDSAYKASEILSKIVFAKPKAQPLKLSEKNHCNSIKLEDDLKLKGIEADLAVFFALSDNFMQNLTSFKVCEVSNENQLKSIEIMVNRKMYQALNEDKKVSLLSRGITSAIFNGESEKDVKEIEDNLEALSDQPILKFCSAPCATCVAGSNVICATCIAGYIISGTACLMCSSQCYGCQNTVNTCIACIDTIHMSAAPACSCPTNGALSVFNGNRECACNPGYYFSSNLVCSPCASQCYACSVSASTCLVCIDTVHMGNPPTCSCPAYSTLTAGVCTCNTGYYFSSNTVCSACAPQCVSCSTTNFNCGSCIDTVHMTAAPACACPTNGSLVGNICACNIGYYFSSNTVCSPCQPNCASCDNNPNTCDTCKDTTHMSAAPTCACPTNSALTGNTCVCNTGYYYSSNTVCSACNSNCQTCATSQANCLTCIDSVHMSAAPACDCPALSTLVGNSCVCNTGYYFSTPSVCSPCNNNCASCANTAANCNTCIDTTHMSAAPACACPTNASQNGNTCQCNPSYYFSNSVTCSACNTNCATCDTNPTICDTCIDPVHMTAAPNCQCPAQSTLIAGSCICNPGYYYSSATTCSACSVQCATCSQFSTNCGSCVDTLHMSSAPNCNCPVQSSLVGSVCVCNSGYYFSSNTICSPISSQCAPQCAQCSSYDFCTVCNDPANTYLNTVTGTCRCWDPYASFNQSSGVCQCIQGYYLASSGVCQICMAPCSQCSTAANFCTECDDSANMNLNINTGTCTCKDPNSQFNPWVKACQNNPGCNCTRCETIYNYNNITNIYY